LAFYFAALGGKIKGQTLFRFLIFKKKLKTEKAL